MSTLTVHCWNLEQNGKQDPALRQKAHELLALDNPALVLRQEMPGADDDGAAVMYELEDVLGMRGWLGPRSCTAVFADQKVFRTVREWPQTGPMWVLPPTALTMRYLPAGWNALPLVVGSFHLNYASGTTRLAEAEWLTTWADKRWTTPGGETVRIPALLGGDTNSYPEPSGLDEPALPALDAIRDEPHRANRSYHSPDGRRMDTRPDEVLYTAGLHDVAQHHADRPGGSADAIAPTVDACETHGPEARIDRVYVTAELLPAVTDVDVIPVPLVMSDHHVLRLTLDGDLLADILNRQPVGSPSFAR
ncbi:endonuclease/exonuclease/phosphatase family protein [Streptomyces jumonjinensis]|uniref:Endonuclease/exonuclease/phosphatase family protein n=1 Tax=Streptomyces jumonjinensis TaxID=1945 RepID=A0A646KRF4_STRJU|nr:endonuclease/exonuclease/phosphatase family protein [Streptomyces jumonjinensis]MQT04815.1 endonuclease/exonuclease/phosphatase family protein [Streptomyces jumonjinensis]